MSKISAGYCCLLALLVIAGRSRAQSPVVSLNQNFDVACVIDGLIPDKWVRINPLPETIIKGMWTCTSELGRPRDASTPTPGMSCSSYFDNSFHLDTAYLLMPKMNFASYTGGKVFLRFDARTSSVVNGSDLSIFITDSEITSINIPGLVDSNLMKPTLSNPKDTTWGTHEIDMTTYESSPDFFLGFRYISPASYGSIWYIDNVLTSSISVFVKNADPVTLKFAVKGISRGDKITLSYDLPESGEYTLTICDMMGRELHKEKANLKAGPQEYTMENLNLQSGMYCIRMNNEQSYGVIKAMVL